jgi:AraC-like DNA-binding protein
MARLARAARLFENSGLSVSNVATHLEYSSPQSFGRHVRTLLGLTAVGFRSGTTGRECSSGFRSDLVRPHAPRLRAFDPLRAHWPRLTAPRTR